MTLMQNWKAVVCGFVLFVVVSYVLLTNHEGHLNVAISPEPGMLLFMLPGVVAGGVSRQHALKAPLMGGLLALPLCLLMMDVWLNSPRSLWQSLAWLLSGEFWLSLGALSILFFRSIMRLSHTGRHRSPF